MVLENAIDNLIEDPDPNYDVFLKIENNSIYQLNDIQVTSYSSIYINKLKPHNMTGSFGEYSILEGPYISFYINNNLYEHNFSSPQTRIESGKYILKINVLSTSLHSFNFEIVEDTE
ncbi:MAG: hypothetical protein COA67_05585 [Lutibacter sp.]|nr:MAG: hypothetical protein COA67_05585 [Lutibacter sp.]